MDAEQHESARTELERRLRDDLGTDERFVAAWLGGSLGRGDGDAWSDIDLWLVVAEEATAILCSRPEWFGAPLAGLRRELAERFGDIAVAGENAVNAGPEGVAMNVVYREGPLVVDWGLVPAAVAMRPADTRLLFDHAGIPLAPPPAPLDPDEAARLAEVEVAQFWYFVATLAKAIQRGDAALGIEHLRRLRHGLRRAEAYASLAEPGFIREPGTPVAATPTEQLAALHEACAAMQETMTRVAAIGGKVPREPMEWVERLVD